MPLKGICVLTRGVENHIQRAEPEAVLSMLQKQSYRPGAESKYPRFLELVEVLSRQVPLWQMACNRQPEAAEIAFRAMSSAI